MTFPRAPLGRRGLDEESVRAFIQQVEQELARVLGDNAALNEEIARLRRRVLEVPSEHAHLQAVRLLSQAQQTADQYVAEAERVSRELAEEARRHRDELLAEAKVGAMRVLEDANRQASASMDAAPVHRDGPGNGPPGRELSRELDHLRTTAEVYRNHLRAYLEALLRGVDDWERSERSSLPGA